MSTKIQIDNYTSLNVKEQTSLTADVTPPTTNLQLANNNNIIANDYLLIGNPGAETAEIKQVQSVSGATAAIVGPTTLTHNNGEKVLALFGNKIKVYRAVNVSGIQPADTDFVELATIDIDPDQLQTIYIDPAGSSNYWYKFVYYNSANSEQTSLADSGASRGGGIGQYATLDSIRSLAGFENNRNISDSLVEQFRQAAQAEIDGKLAGRYTVPLTDPINPFVANIARTLAAGYLQIDQYGNYSTRDTNNGDQKVTWAQGMLDKIANGEIKLTDQSGTETPETKDLGFAGIPNASTEDQFGNNGFMFKRTDIDGYQGRRY